MSVLRESIITISWSIGKQAQTPVGVALTAVTAGGAETETRELVKEGGKGPLAPSSSGLHLHLHLRSQDQPKGSFPLPLLLLLPQLREGRQSYHSLTTSL